MMKLLIAAFLLVVAAIIVLPHIVHADGMPVQAGYYTDEICTGQGSTTQLTVTTGSGYSANNQVGQLVSLPLMRPASMVGRPSAALMSARLIFNDTQTVEFDVRLYTAQPSSASTLADKTGQTLVGADKLLQLPPLKLTNNDSGGGTTTVYGQDNIWRALKIIPTNIPSMWATVTTPSTPTFTDAHPQLCIGVRQD